MAATVLLLIKSGMEHAAKSTEELHGLTSDIDILFLSLTDPTICSPAGERREQTGARQYLQLSTEFTESTQGDAGAALSDNIELDWPDQGAGGGC